VKVTVFNVWAIVLGGYLYSKIRRQPVASHIDTALFGAALAPVFSEILPSSSIPLALRVPLALATGSLIGFVLAPAAASGRCTWGSTTRLRRRDRGLGAGPGDPGGAGRVRLRRPRREGKKNK